ncbi:MAG: S1C family serine protease [Armatimonadota bacterium]
MMRQGSGCGVIAAAAALSLIMGAVAGIGGAWYWLHSHAPVAGGVAPPPARTQVRVMTDEDAIVNAVAQTDPSVVKIVATTVAQPSNPFEFFFGGPRVQQGLGSGFIFDYNGRKLVLTNAHVVGDAEEIMVQTRDGREFRGEPLGADRLSDVAVLQIAGEAGDLPAAPLGNSDDLKIGEWVVAIGHPFAFDHTVTVGVVSALGQRQLGPAEQNAPVRRVIQTDAAINQGNSGGPLVNLAGAVVGINSMIFSPTGTSLGIGFAIPINDVKQIVHFLIERGPWIGVDHVLPNSAGLARYLGLQAERGVVVMAVAPRSPAEQAGLRQGDVILSVDGQEIANAEELRNAVFRHQIGDAIALHVQRGAQEMNIQVTAGTIPEGYYQ